MPVPRPRPADELRERIALLPVPSPREIDARLEALGYRGQHAARRAMSVLGYRHLRRLRRLHLAGVPPSELPARAHALLVGPTGCGKTHLVELLFREILGVPAVVVDITGFSETGYVGHDVSTVLTRLVDAAEGDREWASCGVVCLDELDKIAGSSSSARFAGQETTKDVSGWGVQRSLLTLLSSDRAEFPPDHGHSGRVRPEVMSVAGVTFVACGAFSGMRRAAAEARPLGFGAAASGRRGEDATLDASAFERAGFLPELLGRFTRFLELEPLGAEELRSILDHEVRRHRRELRADGLDLRLDRPALDAIVEEALRSGKGARGIRGALTRAVEDLLYERAPAHPPTEPPLRPAQGLIRE